MLFRSHQQKELLDPCNTWGSLAREQSAQDRATQISCIPGHRPRNGWISGQVWALVRCLPCETGACYSGSLARSMETCKGKKAHYALQRTCCLPQSHAWRLVPHVVLQVVSFFPFSRMGSCSRPGLCASLELSPSVESCGCGLGPSPVRLG